jgi:hypothetical protein
MKQKGATKMKDCELKEETLLLIDDIPQSVTCPKCGGGIGLWTGSILTICWFCGFHAFKKEMIIN